MYNECITSNKSLLKFFAVGILVFYESYVLKKEAESRLKYFDRYCELVESGEIVVNKYVKLAIKRVKRFKTQYIFK